MILSYHCFQAHKSSGIPLKGLEYSEGSFVCSDKTGLSDFKPDYSVFVGLTIQTELTPSSILSLPTLILSRTTVTMPSRPPLAISWLLCGILEFLGEINSQEPVYLIPPPVFLFSRYFHLILDLFAPWIDLKYL
jgi:hypothetical protein